MKDVATDTPMAGVHVVRKLRDIDATLAKTVPRVFDPADDEAIHDLRVAIRRLRTMLKMSGVLLGRWHADVVRRAFADVQRATGELRDEETLEETLAKIAEDGSFANWTKARKAREARLRQAVIAILERGELDRARLLLKALLVFPPRPSRDVELARFARRTVERARREVEARRDVGPEDVVGLHDLRIAYKVLRYSIELLAEALPLDVRAMLEPATIFQKRLGEVHDADVALEVVRNSRDLPAAARERALAELEALRRKRIEKYVREVDPLRTATAAATPENGAT